MLKIRITGSENELRQIAHKAGNTNIKRFKHANGKTTHAIDIEISVTEFLSNIDLGLEADSGENKISMSNCNAIQSELQDVLKIIDEK